MDLKEVEPNFGRRPIQKYTASPAEVARARVGFVLMSRGEALSSLPIHGIPEGSDGHFDRDTAEYIVAGNLALLHDIAVEWVALDLGQAKYTVTTGLKALEEGATKAAEIFEDSK